MRKYISLIIIGLSLIVGVRAQTPETLTNSSVVKMSNANLSDELIIDMIRDSPVRFSLEDADQRSLKNEGVSENVINAMLSRGEGENPPAVSNAVPYVVPDETASVTRSEAASVTRPESANKPVTEYMPAEVVDNVPVVALNYIIPLTDLITFNDKEFRSFEATLVEWDKKIRTLTSDVNRVKDQMLQTENELRKIKNTGTGTFSSEILALQKKLDVYRKNYSDSKVILVSGGKSMFKWLDSEMGNRVRDLGKEYSSTVQSIMSADINPATGEQPATMQFAVREVSETTSGYIVYATELLNWYQNEMKEMNNLIQDWNPRVSSVVSGDARLKAQLDPLEAKLEELKANSKQNKNEISGLKKQISDLEKARKEMAGTMKDDAKELASILKQKSQNNKESLNQRFADILENITYSFEEKLSL